MTKIINNNLWSPVPWGWGCNGCNGGNNWLNNIFGYQMMFGMMNNMFSNLFAPQQRQQAQLTPQTYNPYGNFYPGLSLGGATQGNTNPSYEEYMEKMQAQNDLTQLKQTWSEFKFSNVGGKYQAVLKADKSVVLNGDTTDELMSNIIGYVNENPTQFKTKEKVEKDTDKDGAGEINEDDTPDAPDNNDTASAKTRKVKQDWYMASNSQNQTLKAALTYDALAQDKNKAAEKAAEAIITAWGNQATGVNKEMLRKALIIANPSVFNQSNGALINNADMDKLDLPTINWMKEHCTTSTRTPATPATPRTPSTTPHRNLNGKYLVAEVKDYYGYTRETPQIKWNNGNMIYKSYVGNNLACNSDLVIRIDGYDYKIDGEDFFKALGLRDNGFWSGWAGGNSNIIDPKTGQFKSNGTWPEGGFTLNCVQKGNAGRGKNLENSRLTVENGKVVLIVGKNRFLMDNVMNGTIPSNQINGNKNNKYAKS